MEKCFAYLRVSGAGQVEKDGFTRQEKAITDYARAHKYRLQTIFKDEGVTGTIEDRPALAQLMVSLEQNGHGIKTVIIERLERLARDLMVQEAIIRDFADKGFNLISVAEGPDLSGQDPTRKLIRQLFGAIAEYDKTMTVLKLRAARERQRQKIGKCEGRKGYRDSQRGRAILYKIRALRRTKIRGKRRTWQQVADKLNEEDIPTLHGKQWTLHRVQQIAREYFR